MAGFILECMAGFVGIRNVDEIARLLTDPQAADAFRALVNAPRGSQRMIGATARLYSISQRVSNRESGRKTPK